MRVDLLTPVVEVGAAQVGLIELEVLNDSDVIEQVTASVPELASSSYEARPLALTLFPGESGRLSVSLGLPRSYPMGQHDMPVSVEGRMGGARNEQSVDVRVHELVDIITDVVPRLVVGRTKGAFDFQVDRGNVAVEVAVHASDDTNHLQFQVTPEVTTVPAGGSSVVRVQAKGRRPFFGAPRYHKVTITGEHLPEVEIETVEFRQKARITTGMITALMLMFIIAAWAFGLLFAARAFYGTSAPMKTVAANFATGSSVKDMDPSLVGGSVAGRVLAASTGAPLARVTVELHSARAEAAGATPGLTVATGPDGSYHLDGVLPGRYRVLYGAPGFGGVWFPDAGDATAATVVSVAPKQPTSLADVKLAGGGGTLDISVVAGDDAATVITVTVEAVDGAASPPGQPFTLHTNVPLTITGLVTPATYRISATAPSFQSGSITQAVPANGTVTANPIVLTAASGTISGLVRGLDHKPLGGITVTTTSAGKPVTTLTPTDGAGVGKFSLTGLPTPATYVLEFSGPGLASTVASVKLGAGGTDNASVVTMGSATGTIKGLVRQSSSRGLGGVTITVQGGGFTTSVTSFTGVPVGSYLVTGLPVPGTYVVTFSMPGRFSVTDQVSVTSTVPIATKDALLVPSVATLKGIVYVKGSGAGNIAVTVSDGVNVRSTVTSADPATKGTFAVPDLPPGVYTVTASFGTFAPVSYVVHVGEHLPTADPPLTMVLA